MSRKLFPPRSKSSRNQSLSDSQQDRGYIIKYSQGGGELSKTATREIRNFSHETGRRGNPQRRAISTILEQGGRERDAC